MKLIKEIKSKSGEVHFRRWEILKTRCGSIWLHAIYKADQDKHLHNHPWDFKSLVLKGSYLEQTEKGIIDVNILCTCTITEFKAIVS